MPIHIAGAAANSITGDRLARAKFAYTTRHVRSEVIGSLVAGRVSPQPGDLVLARVDELGSHNKLELIDGRRATLFEQDEIVVCCGNRYAPDQFEAEVLGDLGPCDLAAAGGAAARGIVLIATHRLGRPRREPCLAPPAREAHRFRPP